MPRFGERLQLWLHHIGMNYRDFDHAAGLTSEYTSKLIRGKRKGGMDKPTYATRQTILQKLAELTGEPMTSERFERGPNTAAAHGALEGETASALEDLLRSDTPITYEGVPLTREERDFTLAQISLLRKTHRR